MIVESLFNLGDVIYVKSILGKYVTRGIVTGIAFEAYSLHFTGEIDKRMFRYQVWVSDREDNSGKSLPDGALEINCYASWEDAWWERRGSS